MDLDDSDKDEADDEANPLVVPMNDQLPSQDEITSSWFDQDIFAGVEDGQDEEMAIDDQDQDDEVSLSKKPKEKVSRNHSHDMGLPKKASKVADDDFEIVPAPETDSSDDDSSSEKDSADEYDDDTKAEILACAKKMMRKKQREQILDDGYNKYMFHDDKGLPSWFVEEEKKHSQLMKPVTKEEVDAMKAQFREINARPVKKVAEARARKKRVAARQLEKIRKKANIISDQSDIPDRSKSRLINQLYTKAAPKKPKGKEYVVAKKGVQVRTGKGKVLVDRRMKSDARKQGAKQAKKASKGKKGGKGPVKGSGKKGQSPGGRKRPQTQARKPRK